MFFYLLTLLLGYLWKQNNRNGYEKICQPKITHLKVHVQHVLDVYTTTKLYTTKYDINSFKYQGVKILNDLKKINIYQNKSKFWKELKSNYVA